MQTLRKRIGVERVYKFLFLHWIQNSVSLTGKTNISSFWVSLSACLWDWQSTPSANSETSLPPFMLQRLCLNYRKADLLWHQFPSLGEIPSCEVLAETNCCSFFFSFFFLWPVQTNPKTAIWVWPWLLLWEWIGEPALLKCWRSDNYFQWVILIQNSGCITAKSLLLLPSRTQAWGLQELRKCCIPPWVKKDGQCPERVSCSPA